VREGIIAGARDSPAPTMVASTLPELLDDESAWRFAQSGVPAVAGLRTGIRCAAAMRTPVGDPERLREIAAFAHAAAAARAAEGDGRWLGEHETKQLLRGAGVNVVEGRVVAGPDDAATALDELGGRIALKLSAASVQHKSELGGVVLGLDNVSAVRAANARLASLAERHGGVVLAERMAPPGVELLVAARTDGIVPALVLGLGGVWTELLDDVAIVPLPATARRIERALRSLRGAPLLLGGRGRDVMDLPAACELARQVGELLLARSLALVELNPVFVCAEGAIVADAKAVKLCTT
jgi:acyl-CoA synthetase (NDP forming)